MVTIINGKPLLARLQVCLIPPPYLTAARNGGDEIDNVGEFSTSNAAATGTGHTGVSPPDVPIELSLRSSNTWLKPSVPQDLALPGIRGSRPLDPEFCRDNPPLQSARRNRWHQTPGTVHGFG
jgi:hypothetical protein